MPVSLQVSRSQLLSSTNRLSDVQESLEGLKLIMISWSFSLLAYVSSSGIMSPTSPVNQRTDEQSLEGLTEVMVIS